MASSKRMKWAELEPSVRAELEAILEAHRAHQPPLAARFHSDADELMPFVLLGFLVAVGGLIACVYLIMSSSEYDDIGFVQRFMSLIRYPRAWVTTPEGGVIGTTLGALALAVFWVRHRGRRGLALTDNAIVVVRGPRLKILPLAEIAGSAQSAHGYRGQRFTVLKLTMKDGRRQDLITIKHWADAAEAGIAAIQAAKGRS